MTVRATVRALRFLRTLKCSPETITSPFLLFLVLMSDSSLAEQKFELPQSPPYGKYVCITDKAVGFQPSLDSQSELYSGAIAPSTEIAKFFIDIEKITIWQVGNKIDPEPHFIPKSCKEQWEKIEESWLRSNVQVNSDLAEFEDTNDRFVLDCAEKTSMQITTSGSPARYYSTNRNIFRSDIGADVFWIVNQKGSYLFRWHTSSFNTDYIFKGRCELIK